MSKQTGVLLSIFCAGLIVLFRVYYLVRRLWTYPLDHGPGFFLGVEVAPGFYDGPGVRWLKRWRTVILAEHSIEALALAAIIVLSRWDWVPLWAGGSAPLFVATMLGFMAYTRAKLRGVAPVRSSIAVALETRRLGDYISWSVETVILMIIAASWLLLLAQGDAQVRWQAPVVMTYTAVALLSGKVLLVRGSFPLPAERTAEHQRWFEAQRRHSLRMMDAFRWVVVAPLAGYALLHGWAAAQGVLWWRWLFIAIMTVLLLVMAGLLIRGEERLAAMGRDLRPIGSWSGPFRSARLMLPGGVAWSAVYLTGLVLLLVFFRR